MKLHYPFLFASTLFIISYPSFSQDFQESLVDYYSSVFQFNKNWSGEFLTTQNALSDEDKAFAFYIERLNDFVNLMIDRDRSRYEDCLERFEENHEQLKQLDSSLPFVNFVEAELKLQEGLIRLHYGDQFYGAVRLIQAWYTSEKNIKNFTQQRYFLKTSGVLNIMLSLIPDRYHFILSMLNVNPDLSTGIGQLDSLSSDNSLFSLESKYILALLNAFYLQNPDKANKIMVSARKGSYNNFLTSYLNALISVKSRNNDLAIKYFQNCQDLLPPERNLEVLDYFLGISYLKKLSLDSSSYYLKSFVSNHGNEDYIKDTYFKLSLIAFLRNQEDSVLYFNRKVLDEGILSTENDEYAYNMALNDEEYHPQLLRARFLFDGGYFRESLKTLEKINIDSLSRQYLFEFYYRMGRLYQLSKGKEDIAVMYYLNQITMSDFSEHYLMANGHLQLGHLYFNDGDFEKAELHFKKALEYKGDIYRNSIRNEAKAALEMVTTKMN